MTRVDPDWFAIWTHSHCEQLVFDQLRAKGFQAFLPTVREWTRRAGVGRTVPRPMFPSYLFVRHAMDKISYIEIMKTRGLVRILGERWDRLVPVAHEEMSAIECLVNAGVPVLPYPFLRDGDRVRITHGALAGIEGILVRSRPRQGLLVLSVNLLSRSVAVEIACEDVVPCGRSLLLPQTA